MQDFIETSSSGGKKFRGHKVRRRENQGLPAFALRKLKISSRNSLADKCVAIAELLAVHVQLPC
jgi:hypothetical protein